MTRAPPAGVSVALNASSAQAEFRRREVAALTSSTRSGTWCLLRSNGQDAISPPARTRAGSCQTRPSLGCVGCLRLLRPDEGAPVGVERSGVVTDELGGRVDGAVRAGHRGAVVAPPAGRAKAKGLVAGEAVL